MTISKTEYTVVVGTTVDKLVAKVNHCMTEGWRPVGGASVSLLPASMLACQSMTRETRVL